jgi:hypothetical protein
MMLSPGEAERIFALRAAGLSRRAIARELGHSQNTIMRYLRGDTIPGARAARPDLLTDTLAGYCRQRFADDPHLRPRVVLAELTALGYQGSRPTFYRGLRRHGLLTLGCQQCGRPQGPAGTPRPTARELRQTPQLPIQVPLISGEFLISYLGRLAAANHLTLAEVLTVLPTWFRTKTRNHDDRSQHHTLSAAAPQALQALARITGRAPANLARALPAFGTGKPGDPVRATTACCKCAVLGGISQPVPVHLPAHVKVCTRHGVWHSGGRQPQLDLVGCPEIIAAQHRASRLLRRLTPQQLILAQLLAVSEITRRPHSANSTSTWNERLQILQAANCHLSTEADLETLTRAARYPDVVALAAIMPGHHACWQP